MAEFPALPIFTDAYLGDTRHLTTSQHGAYFLLLMIAWRSIDCALPDDDIFLARCVGMDRRTWANNKPSIMSFWFINPHGKWQQKRLLDERNFAEQMRYKNSLAGKASALKRKNRGSTSVQQNSNQTATPSPSPSPSPIPKEAKASSTLPPSTPAASRVDDEGPMMEKQKVYHQLEPHPEFGRIREYIVGRLPHLGKQNATEINRWLYDGATADDIVQTVDHCVSVRGAAIGSFNYFTAQVMACGLARKERDEQVQRVRSKYAD